MDIQTRIDITPRKLLAARLKSDVIYSRNSGELKTEQQYKDALVLLEDTPGENFKEIRQNILANSKNHSLTRKIQGWLSKQAVPNIFGFPISLEIEEKDLNSSARSSLKKITVEALRKPSLESALENIQNNPDSSTAQFQQNWLLAGINLTGVPAGEPEYRAYSEVFPFVKDWG